MQRDASMNSSEEYFVSRKRKRQILVVDDEIINREILYEILKSEYDILFAENGQEALRVMHEYSSTLALVLMDILMPVMNGMDVLREVGRTPDLSRIPIIMVTSEQRAEVESLRLGAIDFIPKPYPASDVILARVYRTIELSEDRQIIHSTERDPLTGLYNREYFYSYAQQFDLHQPDVMTDAAVLDINHFHVINERYGKAFADDVLRMVAQKLQDEVHARGGIVCREEADTFLIYGPHREDYSAIMERAADLFSEDGASTRIRLRMGLYQNTDRTIDIERRFDRAKNAADTIRNNYASSIAAYDEQLHQREIFSDRLMDDFQTAIDEHQFVVYYQPKYNVTGTVPVLSSAEALVRWKHPVHGMIPPGVFIPILEENGLIRELDRYVWQQAASQIRAWKDRFSVTLPVSVNVSRVDMLDERLLDTLREIVHQNGIETCDLLLEMTESAYTDDEELIIRCVKELRQSGFRIEMDDFGTGYSSLGMISNLPIDVLKMDMKFVQNAFSERHDIRMLELIMDIADYLNVPVIAEGVETEEQMMALKAMGCELIQGYYFSKPVPPEEFEKLILRKIEIEKTQNAPEDDAGDSAKEKKKNAAADLMSFSQAMNSGFDSLYYVDTQTGYYMAFGSQMWDEELKLQKGGTDFFADIRRDVLKVIYPEDQAKVLEGIQQDHLLSEIRNNGIFSLTYRILIGGEPKYYHLQAAQTRIVDDAHIVIGVRSVDDKLSQAMAEDQENTELVSLSMLLEKDYESIYYVDMVTDTYSVLTRGGMYEKLQIKKGFSFFEDCQYQLLKLVYEDDRESMSQALRKDYMEEQLARDGSFSCEYRLLFDGMPIYYRMNGFYLSDTDRRHLAIGVENVDEEVRRRESFRETEEGSVTFARIAQALSQDYFLVYYINVSTHTYLQYSMRGADHQLTLMKRGEDFFRDAAVDLPGYVAPTDRDRVLSALDEKGLLKAVSDGKTFSINYQVLLDGQHMHVNVKAMLLDGDQNHMVIGMSNIDEQVQREKEYEEAVQSSVTYSRIAQALAADYFSIYYVNVEDDTFVEFSADESYDELGIEKSGSDFFNLSRENVMRVMYPEDQRGFLTSFTKENILRTLDENGTFTLNYRLMFGGIPTWVGMKIRRMEGDNSDHIVIGVNNVHSEMQRRQETITYASIAEALASDYFSIYYVDTETDQFIEYSSHKGYEELNIEKGGNDFFNLSRKNILRVVYPEDQERFLKVFTKENLLSEMDRTGTFTLTYRLLFSDKPTYVSMKATRMTNEHDKHIVIGVNNVDMQMRKEEEFHAAQKLSQTHIRIIRALARDYFSVYLVNIDTDAFTEYSASKEYQGLNVEQSGVNFFEDCKRNVLRLVYPEDLDKALKVWEKKWLLPQIEKEGVFSTTYRLMMNGRPVYINCKVVLVDEEEIQGASGESQNNRYIVIGVSNYDAQIAQEQEYARQLQQARDMAQKDALTGVKSKHAFVEAEEKYDSLLSQGSAEPFAVVVCDVNDLKKVNDHLGHKAGDEYVQNASRIICNIFKHSPVFRIGGDEFVSILSGQDYEARNELVGELRARSEKHRLEGGIVIASGISELDAANDTRFQQVFDRADQEMYEDKTRLKAMKA